jgi:hypothetical protein
MNFFIIIKDEAIIRINDISAMYKSKESRKTFSITFILLNDVEIFFDYPSREERDTIYNDSVETILRYDRSKILDNIKPGG